jgi:hypothetical protein
VPRYAPDIHGNSVKKAAIPQLLKAFLWDFVRLWEIHASFGAKTRRLMANPVAQATQGRGIGAKSCLFSKL